MKSSRRWIRLVLLAVLTALALASMAIILLGRKDRSKSTVGLAQAPVVVALRPVEAGQVLTAEDVGVQPLDSESLPSGAVTRLQDAMGQVVGRDLAEGDVLLVTDLSTLSLADRSAGTSPLDQALGREWVAVALQAPDLWSQWGGIRPGDHLDLLATIEITVASDLPPLVASSPPSATLSAAPVSPEQVILWTVQDLEVLQVIEEPLIEEPPIEAPVEETGSPMPYVPARRLLLVLKAVPQDAAVLHFLQHADATLDLAVRASQNDWQFDVDAVTLDYLLRRYSPNLEGVRPYPQEPALP